MAKLSDLIAANKPVFTKFLIYSIILFVSSLGAFFLVRSDSVSGYFELSKNGRDIFSAAAAVAVSYSVIAVFAWQAMYEEDGDGKPKQS